MVTRHYRRWLQLALIQLGVQMFHIEPRASHHSPALQPAVRAKHIAHSQGAAADVGGNFARESHDDLSGIYRNLQTPAASLAPTNTNFKMDTSRRILAE